MAKPRKDGMIDNIITEELSEKAVLVGLITPQQNEMKANEYLDELAFLADTAGATVVKNFTLTVAAGGSQTLDVASNLVFDKNGDFSTESFGNGGNYDF